MLIFALPQPTTSRTYWVAVNHVEDTQQALVLKQNTTQQHYGHRITWVTVSIYYSS